MTCFFKILYIFNVVVWENGDVVNPVKPLQALGFQHHTTTTLQHH